MNDLLVKIRAKTFVKSFMVSLGLCIGMSLHAMWWIALCGGLKVARRVFQVLQPADFASGSLWLSLGSAIAWTYVRPLLTKHWSGQ